MLGEADRTATPSHFSMASEVVTATVVAPEGDNTVGKKLDALFQEVDANNDGKISLEELTNALDKAFPNMAAWAKEHIPVQCARPPILPSTRRALPCRPRRRPG